jgi:hypothetical protein
MNALRYTVLLIVFLTCFAAPACRFPNCEHIVDDRCVEEPDGGGAPCASTMDCMSPSVCDTVSQHCVQCVAEQPGTCGGATPSCGSDHVCHGCIAHADCTSQTCLPDGTCAAEADVAYVDARASDTPVCTRAMPCLRIAAALLTGRHYIKLHGTIDEGVTVETGYAVTFLADPGAVLTRSTSGGPVLLVRGNATAVAIYDLAIADAVNAATIGIVMPSSSSPSLSLTRTTISNNPGGGISASGGSLAVTRSIVERNRGGGVTVLQGARFDITNTIFFANGSPGSPTGAVAIATAAAPGNRLQFNTFYENISLDGVGAAIDCSAGDLIAENNVLFTNGTLSSPAQIGGSCTHMYSLVQPGPLPAGDGNLAADPRFAGADSGDFHLHSGSPAIRAADPDSLLTGATAHDFDGVTRTSPATIGAYQPR